MRFRQDAARLAILAAGALALWAAMPAALATAQIGPAPKETSADGGKTMAADVAKRPKLPDPEGVKRLSEQDRVWIDAKKHEVIVDGYVALREGYLEMFACPVGTKEHESIIGVETRAATVHAALLAVGAIAGKPVKFQPKFSPPEGTDIEIEIRWIDADGKWQSARAQEWIREAESKKEMSHGWVFAGSGFWTDEETSKRYYMAEAGDFICVSNFTTATLDVPFESSQSNDALQFESFTERIPKIGTPVRLVLKPVLDKKDDAKKDETAKKDEAAKKDDADKAK